MNGSVSLDTDVRFVRGVGPFRAQQFAQLGVRTVGDLLEHFPFRHTLNPRSQAIGDLEYGVVATVVGELRNIRTSGHLDRQTISADIVDGTGRCRVRWFNSSYLRDRLVNGQAVRITGKVELRGDLASFTNPEITPIDVNDPDPLANDCDLHEPVYPATAKLPSRQIHRIINEVLERGTNAVYD
ncbi:MAG: OB-fold nucleic acid binding domain-containing protein, partial [Phycisphaerales bacterium]|nr:OB-fold nucleic acid binding domain-containing protein [Phycisphaerales bacterium]